MGPADLLRAIPVGALVGLDTAPVIYLLEAHSRYGPLALRLYNRRIDPGVNRAVTSVVTLAEVLVKPFREHRPDLIERYRSFLTDAPNLLLVPVSESVAERAAELRSRYRILLPDALQLATALEHGASHFITNDARLRQVGELRVLVLSDFV